MFAEKYSFNNLIFIGVYRRSSWPAKIFRHGCAVISSFGKSPRKDGVLELNQDRRHLTWDGLNILIRYRTVPIFSEIP